MLFFVALFRQLGLLVSVNLREVKEIRPGRNSKDFDKWQDEAKRLDSGTCFVLYYGQEFRLNTVSLVGKTRQTHATMHFLFHQQLGMDTH